MTRTFGGRKRWLWLLAALVATPVAWAAGDPTAPTSLGRAPSGGGGGLESVLISPARQVAVIDGRVVRVGDAVGRARVLEINARGVRLAGPTRDYWLSLPWWRDERSIPRPGRAPHHE